MPRPKRVPLMAPPNVSAARPGTGSMTRHAKSTLFATQRENYKLKTAHPFLTLSVAGISNALIKTAQAPRAKRVPKMVL